MIYSSGIWTVKEGREDDFRGAWESNVSRYPAAEHPGLVFRLLRDADHPRRYVSVVGPWKSVAELERVRGAPEFGEWLERVQETLESVEVATYELVVEVS